MKKSFCFPRSLRMSYHKWVLDIVKFILCIYRYGHIVFLLWLIDVMEYMNWFSNVEVTLHIWKKSHMVLSYDSFLCVVGFDMLIFCRGFFCIYVYQTFVLVISSFPFLLSLFSVLESPEFCPYFFLYDFFSSFEYFPCEMQFDSKLFSFIC